LIGRLPSGLAAPMPKPQERACKPRCSANRASRAPVLPIDAIESATARPGVPGSIDTAIVRHISGGRSRLTLKSFDAGRESFQGAKVDVGWADEEPPQAIYSELLTRLLSTVPGEPSGLLLATFTPMLGLSGVVLSFLPGGRPLEGATVNSVGDKWYTMCGMDEVPHVSKAEREKLAASYMPHEREARTKGIPSLGSGSIYPIAESEFVCRPFELKDWHRRAFALDIGWRRMK
jgi:phage terminase large subunit-like protein